MTTSAKLVLSWANFEQWMESLVRELKEHNPPIQLVYGIPRGGSCAAVTLSHRLGVPCVLSLDQVNSFHFAKGIPYESILFVDEIVDSGETMRAYLTIYPKVAHACWCVREAVKEKFPNLLSHMTLESSRGEWVVFPWEDRKSWEQEKEAYNASRQ